MVVYSHRWSLLVGFALCRCRKAIARTGRVELGPLLGSGSFGKAYRGTMLGDEVWFECQKNPKKKAKRAAKLLM